MNFHIFTFTSIIICSTSAFAQPPPQADTLFRYDHSAPLHVRDSLIEATSGWSVYDISYASPRFGRVTGYLVTPAQKGRYPGIVFGHWGEGNRTEFLPEAKLYAQAGAISLMIDYPWVRPAPYRVNQGQGFGEAGKDLAAFTQAVVDLRRGIDLLMSRPDVDTSRIAYVGHSYGAQWGAILSAVDKRMKTSVLMAGVPSDSVFWVESTDPSLVAYQESATKEAAANYLRTVTMPLAAISYVSSAKPLSLLFQFARKDRGFSLSAMNRYYNAASEPKAVKWYDTGHELNDPQALIDRAEWLGKHIGIKSLKPIFEEMLK
jgi:cephalosporin-C deacetylase-like acetyl esterase